MKAWSEAAWQVLKGPAVCVVSSLQWQPLTGDVDVGMIADTSSLWLQCPQIIERARWLAGAAIATLGCGRQSCVGRVTLLGAGAAGTWEELSGQMATRQKTEKKAEV